MTHDTLRAHDHKPMLLALSTDFGNPDLRGVAADWFEERSRGPFVAIQTGNYRHKIIGLYSRLDRAMAAGEQAIIDEADHYHDVEIVEARQDVGGEFTVLVLRWLYADGKPHSRTSDRRAGRVGIAAIAQEALP